MIDGKHEPDDGFCEVIITAPDAEWLADFARRLVEDHLAAAAHLFPIRSLYRWRGELHDETETRLSLHTRSSLVPDLIDRTSTEHPYQVPGIITLPISQGNPAYPKWIDDQTRSHDTSS